MNTRVKSYVSGLIVGSVILTGFAGSQNYGVKNARATVSSYTASAFSQYCSQNPSSCVKVNFSDTRTGTVTCPNGLIPQTIYVHAGDGQTVYQLPHEGFSYSLNGSAVTVTLTTHQHDISWIGVVCSGSTSPSPSVSASPSDTPCPSDSPKPSDSPNPSASTKPSTTPEASASVKPSHSPAPSASAKPSPSESASPSPSESASPNPSVSSTPSPSSTSTPAPSSSPNNNNNNNSSNTSSNNDSGSVAGTSTEEGEVLGDYAATGIMEDVIMNAIGSVGGLMSVYGAVLYGKKKRS